MHGEIQKLKGGGGGGGDRESLKKSKAGPDRLKNHKATKPAYNVGPSAAVYRLTVFRQEQAGPLKQNDWGPSPKLRGLGFGGKLSSF